MKFPSNFTPRCLFFCLFTLIFASCASFQAVSPELVNKESELTLVQAPLPEVYVRNMQRWVTMFLWDQFYRRDVEAYLEPLDSEEFSKMMQAQFLQGLEVLMPRLRLVPQEGNLSAKKIEGKIPKGGASWQIVQSLDESVVGEGLYFVLIIDDWSFNAGPEKEPSDDSRPDFGHYKVYVSYQIIDATSGKSLWSGSSEGSAPVVYFEDLEKIDALTYFAQAAEKAYAPVFKHLKSQYGIK